MSTTTATPPAFTLTAPEVITPVEPPQAVEAVPLKPEVQSQVDQQVQRFIDALEKEDLHSEPFKARLDSAFQLGRQEISVAASLMQGRLMQRNFVGATDTPAYQAIHAIRAQLDELNPGKDGDLLQPRKLLGLIPFGNKLEAYFRRFESASSQLQKSMTALYAAKDDIQKDVIDIEGTRGKLWEAMQSLAAAARFAKVLDARLAERVEQLKPTDPMKAKALEQEVLFYARQNLADIQTQQAVCVNGYLALDVLKKTGREMMIGCDRVATTGMSALAVAQTVARATGNQIEVMHMLQGVNQTIGNLIQQTGTALNQHVEKTAEFAANPMLGIEQIQSMFDQTFQAMDAMDSFRSKAIETMGKNNALIEAQLQRSETYLDRVRQQQAREAVSVVDAGPVKL
ncbi:toxic anion resistance protein [Inhella sp.]|uniref:toxic anion resistance protein n=1 Tax=Inhella sp. TaxID=1921806 RepID=UPI0035AF34C9